jgi:RecQ family ATP-dependent DNA helicase
MRVLFHGRRRLSIVHALSCLAPLSSGFVTRPTFRHFSTKMNDLYGDDSFLADFNLEKAIANRNNPRAAKKQKTGTTLDASPLGGNERGPKITMGRTTNPSNMTFADHELPASMRVSSEKLSVDKNLTDANSDMDVEALTTIHHSLPSNNSTSTPALESTLLQYFGHAKFRAGQLDVITAVLGGSDAAVFWATGSGKSLCYQIPALYCSGMALVVSPLISLMQDQVHKLNGMTEAPIATFLGSGQVDPLAESGALNGDYRLVYLTPEKLVSGGFLESLARMHQTKKKITLIAVDESHCVSEWGHDFRPDYRNLHIIRSHPALGKVPILALTATAVPRVQTDIISSLRLSHPYITKQTFDRTNLGITVQKKHRGGLRATLETVLPKLNDNKSTIFYAATKNEVEEITAFLDSKGVSVQAYHAGLSTQLRTDAHTNFLIGKTAVLVGTVAFGMGIDKPDTRRVFHYGPPKTMEEYYQQIGRAGRDGLASEVCMFLNDNDFDKYNGDFYMGSLPAEAKQAMEVSLNALKSFALDLQTCRRKALLDFFVEKPSFGERCGTCDNCQNLKKYGNEMERDLGKLGARVVLKAVDALNEQGLTVIEKVLNGNTVENYRYSKLVNATEVKDYIAKARKEMGKRRPVSYFKDLISPLVGRGYINSKSKVVKINGYSRAFSTFCISAKGLEVLSNESKTIVLTVPQSLRDLEHEDREVRQRVLTQLEEAGINLELIPNEEFESGDGITIQAYLKWNSYIKSLRKRNREDYIQELENLLSRIEVWRHSTAEKVRMAPSTVLAEHLTYSIAYTVATLQGKVEKDALVAVGVRSRELESLVQSIHQWQDDVQIVSSSSVKDTTIMSQMVLPDMFTPPRAWEHAIYKPLKKTGIASWESSHTRFVSGEHPQAIAMSPISGNPVTVATVINHIMEGLVQGRSTPLKRLAFLTNPLPRSDVYDRLIECESMSGMDPVGLPAVSGRDGETFRMTDFLRPIIGDELADKPFGDRTPKDKAELKEWYAALNWYLVFRRIGYEPSFALDE